MEEMKVMEQVVNIEGVECYEKDGVAYLKLENVARGLGFTTTQTVKGTEYTNVRWNRVDEYLQEIGFATSGKRPDFIPENIFYRLAMKAKNETAERFQAKVADEIIPSIRKHGAYMTEATLEKALTSPDFLIQLATQLKKEQEEKAALQEENDRMKPKAEFFDAVTDSRDAIDMGKVAKVLNYPGIGRNRLFEILRDEGILMKNNEPYQKYIDNGCFRTVEQKYSLPDGSTRINIKTLVFQKGIEFIKKVLDKVS